MRSCGRKIIDFSLNKISRVAFTLTGKWLVLRFLVALQIDLHQAKNVTHYILI